MENDDEFKSPSGLPLPSRESVERIDNLKASYAEPDEYIETPEGLYKESSDLEGYELDDYTSGDYWDEGYAESNLDEFRDVPQESTTQNVNSERYDDFDALIDTHINNVESGSQVKGPYATNLQNGDLSPLLEDEEDYWSDDDSKSYADEYEDQSEADPLGDDSWLTAFEGAEAKGASENFDQAPEEYTNDFTEESFSEPSFGSSFSKLSKTQKQSDEKPIEDNKRKLTSEDNKGDKPPLKAVILAKFDGLFAQIKSELRGEGDDDYKPSDRQKGESGSRAGSKVAGFFTKLTDTLLKILFIPLGLLSKLPVIGGFFRKLMNPNKVMRAVSVILPLVLVSVGLYIHGNQALLPPKKLTFPDGGAATFSQLSYDRESMTATGVITNTGEVNAEVSPKFVVHSIQPTINPLSLFYPKPNKPCVGDFIEVNIGEKKKVSVKCKVSGFDRKITGELKW